MSQSKVIYKLLETMGAHILGVWAYGLGMVKRHRTALLFSSKVIFSSYFDTAGSVDARPK